MRPISASEYIDKTARTIMDAFYHYGVEANQVLLYNDLFPYLDRQDRHHRDWLRDAEQALRHDSIIAPDAAGMRLTEMGHRAIYNRRS